MLLTETKKKFKTEIIVRLSKTNNNKIKRRKLKKSEVPITNFYRIFRYCECLM